MTGVSIGGVTAVPANESARRLNMLLWGSAGCGKTTLAATAPGRKLFIQFDPEGSASVAGVKDVDVVDLSGSSNSIMQQAINSTNPLGIKSALEHYETIIVDSLTNVEDKATGYGIDSTKGATVFRPSPGAYGARNAIVIKLVKNMLAVTRVTGNHLIFIAHEGAPVTDDNGIVMHIGVSLGGKIPNAVGVDFSEMWNLYQPEGRNDRRIAIRPVRKRTGLKTRMFIQSGDPEFDWKFDADNWESEKNKPYRLDTWYNMWKDNGFQKINLPK